jgi:hypothetical protein
MSNRNWTVLLLLLATWNLIYVAAEISGVTWISFVVGLLCVFTAGARFADWMARR